MIWCLNDLVFFVIFKQVEILLGKLGIVITHLSEFGEEEEEGSFKLSSNIIVAFSLIVA